MSRRFGRYVIRDETTDELGRGAFGRVYRAFDPNVNRYVAIKVLFSGSDPEMLVRFQDESKTAGQLEHENIVKVYDFDLQDGMPYLVMELLDGETLETVIKTQKVAGLPIQLLDKVEIMFQVAKGLQHAHSENVVHRDIKPGNIMVLPNGTVKVMDFGIARVMDKDGTRRTRQGDIAGTILYMAPEQFSGRDADKRTDIFAYADVYYELLTGEHPFFGSDFATVMYRITANEPRPVREMLPECPVALGSLIHRLLVKDPEIRPDRLDWVLLETQPVLQRLRRERAAVLAAEIEPLFNAGDLDRAQNAIRQVLQLDPLNLVADLWREQIQKERERKTARTRAEALVRKGHEHLAARRFKEAAQSFESALKLDPANPETRMLVDQVRITIENVRNAARLVAEAQTEMERGQLEHAADKAARAAELDSGNAEAPELRDRLRQQILSRREAAMLARAESLCSSGDYDAAVAVLSEAEAAGFSSPKIAACRTRVERERAEAEKRRRQAAFAAALTKARQALYSQRLQEASDSAESLCAEYPDEPAASELLSEVREYLAAQRRLEAINQATQTARALMKEKRLDDARQVLEAGLRAYPRDTGISRLMEIVNTLATAQERARKIGQAVRQAHSMADEGRLDDALRAVLDAIGEFGEETSLIECKRNFQLERDQREYSRGLQARLEQVRRLLAEGNPSGAVGLLEDAMLQYPGEPEIGPLLSSARGALAALRESEFVKQHRSRMAALEGAGQYGAALALMEAALTRYPGNAELLETAGRLRQKLQEQERKRLFAAQVRRVEEAMQSGDWDSAAAICEVAQADFPEEGGLAEYWPRIHEAQRQRAMQELQVQVRASLARRDLEAAERQLGAAQPNLSQDPAWQALSLEFERYRAYDGDLKRAAEASAVGAYDDAEEMLRRWLAEALDRRAAELFEAVSQARREAAERARLEAEERARREAEELARRQQEAAIAKGRSDADALIRKADYRGAIAILDRLAGQYPGHTDIQHDRDAVDEALERQRREAVEQARRQEEAAIAKGRSDADTLIRKADYQGAMAILDGLAGQFPGQPDIQHDREAVGEALERQRREAEDRIRLQQEEAAIAEGRRDVEALVRKADYAGAMAILDRLADGFPGRQDIQQEREAVAEVLERQNREAAEAATRQEGAAIAEGRGHADALIRKADYQGAIAILDRLAGQYPGQPDIERDREAVAVALERQDREASESARRQQEESAIAKGRGDAEALTGKGDYNGAIAMLDELAAQYPHDSGIQRDRESAVQALDRQRREAKEEAYRQEQAAFASQRQHAATLAQNGDYKGAIAILGQLALMHPGHSGIERELEAAARELDRLRLKAEEQKRRKEKAAIDSGRAQSAALIQSGDHAGAIALLSRLAKQHPEHADIERDRDTAMRELERMRVEAAISEERREAAVLSEKGDYQAAIAILQRLAHEHSAHTGIQDDLHAAKLARERQRQEAEEQARLKRIEEGIAQGRRDAAALSAQSAYADAIAMLDQLTGRYGGDPGIEHDRQAAAVALERQRAESAIARSRETAAELIRKGDCQGAIGLLDGLANQYPAHPGIQADREAAQRELQRQREETAIAKSRGDAAALITKRDHRGALALLDQLADRYPGHIEIQRDREAAQRELQRQIREAEEQARRQAEEASIAKARSDAAAMIQHGDYQAALAMLDWFAGQFPDHAGIKADREALGRQLEILRREAEEQERRQRELAVIAKAREDAAGFAERGEYQEAIAVLDRLAGQYPADSGIRADRDAAAAAWERQQRETEERAKVALSVFSARQREVAAASPEQPPIQDDAEQRAKAALAVRSARKQDAPDQADPAAADLTSNLSATAIRLAAGAAAKGRHLLGKLHRGKR